MTPETKHLLYWWIEWLRRLIRTSYHLFNRHAYHKWKTEFYKKRIAKKYEFYNRLKNEDYKLFEELDERDLF
jgi:hypothetical protein